MKRVRAAVLQGLLCHVKQKRSNEALTRQFYLCFDDVSIFACNTCPFAILRMLLVPFSLLSKCDKKICFLTLG